MKTKNSRFVKKIPGTDIQVVKTSASAGLRQIRCSSCHNIMAQARTPEGKEVYRCPSCGLEAASRPL